MTSSTKDEKAPGYEVGLKHGKLDASMGIELQCVLRGKSPYAQGYRDGQREGRQ
jgi:hypothetical protein